MGSGHGHIGLVPSRTYAWLLLTAATHPNESRLKVTAIRVREARDQGATPSASDIELLKELEGSAPTTLPWDAQLSPNVSGYLKRRQDKDCYHFGQRRDLLRLFRNLWSHVIDGGLPADVKSDLNQAYGRSAAGFLG
jgi:hypothetical protein